MRRFGAHEPKRGIRVFAVRHDHLVNDYLRRHSRTAPVALLADMRQIAATVSAAPAELLAQSCAVFLA